MEFLKLVNPVLIVVLVRPPVKARAIFDPSPQQVYKLGWKPLAKQEHPLYESGDRLRPEHEKTIREKLLPFHPECEKKIGSGIDYITVGYHPDFDTSRCLFIVRKDGDFVDFSYWKCIKGFIRKNYPLFAESFILRHFSWRRHSSKPQ